MYISDVIKNLKPALFIGSPGHHKWFLQNEDCQSAIFEAVDFIRHQGIDSYLKREYPRPEDKQIIINRIGEEYYVVDGNKHLTAMLIACPELTVGRLIASHPALIRLWKTGYESSEQYAPYDVYIPVSVDTSALSDARTGTNYFVNPPSATKIITADIPFDSKVFAKEDRGRPLYETALALAGSRLGAAA